MFRLVTENTVEEKVVEKAAVKLHLDRKVIQEGQSHRSCYVYCNIIANG